MEEEMHRTQSFKGSSITNLNFPPMQSEFTSIQKGKPNERNIIFKKNLCNFQKGKKKPTKSDILLTTIYRKENAIKKRRFMCILFASPKVSKKVYI